MIIVTLSVVCTLKGMSRRSIQLIKAILLCIEYGILFVDSVDIHRENYWGGSLRKLWVVMHLKYLCLVLTVSTYIVFDIKKVMGRNVWMCFVSTVST